MSKREKGKFLGSRLIAAVVIIPLLVLFIYYLPPYPYLLGLLLVVSLLAMLEFYSMYRVSKVLVVPSIILGGALLYTVCMHPERMHETLFAGFSILLLLRLTDCVSPPECMKEMGPVSVGLLYLPVFMAFIWYLRNEPSGREYVLFLLAAGWSADSMAYYTGTYLGRKKLCPAISPNKTYVGALGSIMGGAAGGVIIAWLFNIPGMWVLKAAAMGSVIGAVTICGDLVESIFKRDAGVKDSGTLIPGHGGLLDKLDGFLLSAPVLYFMVRAL
jgi:phosphatidate cytidylyltransferase